MEEKQLSQFTFYDFYAEILNGLKDEEAGRMARRICEYMFTDSIASLPVDDKERFYWGNLVDVLQEDKTIELSGKIPKGLNRTIRHFTFYENFYGAIKLMDEK